MVQCSGPNNELNICKSKV